MSYRRAKRPSHTTTSWATTSSSWSLLDGQRSGLQTGERALEPGDCILFPSGPDGAHQLINRSEERVRILLVSNFAMPRAAVKVDGGKMMIRGGPEADASRWFPLNAAVAYSEGVSRLLDLA